MLGKFSELFLFGVAPLLMGLSATAAALPANTIFDVTWLAEDIEGRGVADNVRSTLRIGQDGKINGIGACNNYFSMASVNKTTIEIGQIGSTRKMCPPEEMEQETKFLDALERVSSFRLDEAGKLHLMDKQGEAVLRFARFD